MDLQETFSTMARNGLLAGGLRPVKFLAVIDGKPIEKDLTLVRLDTPMAIVRKLMTESLPTLPRDGSMAYSLTYVPDEVIAYSIFERRKVIANESAEEEDAAVLGRCAFVGCKTRKGLKRCSRCHHVAYCCKDHQLTHWKGAGNKYGRGSEWAHKTSCPRMAGKPLRLELDGVADDKPVSELPADFTYGFVLVKKVHVRK